MPIVDCAVVLGYASAGTLYGSPSARDAVRHWARSSRSAPETPAASANVRHRESLSCAPRPRLDKACARWSVPDIRPAPSRFSQLGFQYCSSAPHTGFQYCAVASITTSSTCCRISHSPNSCNCSGLLPYQLSNWYSSSTSTSATTRSGERGEDYIKQGLGLSTLPPGTDNAHLFALPLTLRIRHAFGLSVSTDYSI